MVSAWPEQPSARHAEPSAEGTEGKADDRGCDVESLGRACHHLEDLGIRKRCQLHPAASSPLPRSRDGFVW